MSIQVTWLEDVKAIRFAVGYSSVLGPTAPDTLAADVLLKANIAAMGLPIEPKLSISGRFFMRSYESTDLCYLVRAKYFTSIKDIKNGVLKGFNEHISSIPFSCGKAMEYTLRRQWQPEINGLF